MIAAGTDALLITAAIAFLLELLHRQIFGKIRSHSPRRPRPVLGLALLLGALAMQVIGAAAYAPLEPGSRMALPMVIAGGIALCLFALPTDVNLPSSRRHFIGTLTAAALLFAGGLQIPFIAIPGLGVHTLGGPTAFVLTLVFVFLFVSMIEICATVPVLMSLVAVAVGLMTFVPLRVNQTVPGQVLCGELVGAIVGRLLAQIAGGKGRPLDKTEVLVVGYFSAAAALSTFVKGLATAGFILPLGVVTIIFVTLAIHGFERTTILRSSPRA
ncbi:MAG: hypothetical protein ABI579_04310 [Candidatus Sumerlaeota bacterium]